MKTIPVLLSLLPLGLAACSGGSPAATSGVPSAAQTAALNYQAAGADMSGVVEQYRAETATMQDASSCQAVEAAYQAQMGPIIDRMTTLSGPMDHYMSGAMGPAAADMGCVAAAMRAEFARHAAVGCSPTDIAANRAEAVQHATTMTGWADHQRIRYEQMGSAVGMMPLTADSTWACVRDADGGFTMDGHSWGAPQGSSTPATTPPTTPGTTTPGPSPWPMPCGGATCPCNDYGHAAGPDGGTSASPGDPVALGQRIFESGIGASGQPLVRTGGSGMMMASACATCHGIDGHGRRTMMFTTPNITYPNLSDPAGMLEPDGSRGSTYTDDLIRRAVVQGTDAAGEALSPTMPHWQLSDEDWSDLLLFLKTLH